MVLILSSFAAEIINTYDRALVTLSSLGRFVHLKYAYV